MDAERLSQYLVERADAAQSQFTESSHDQYTEAHAIWKEKFDGKTTDEIAARVQSSADTFDKAKAAFVAEAQQSLAKLSKLAATPSDPESLPACQQQRLEWGRIANVPLLSWRTAPS